MKIKELEYLPVANIRLVGRPAADEDVSVSLYGHWCHIRRETGKYFSVPADSVVSIVWA